LPPEPDPQVFEPITGELKVERLDSVSGKELKAKTTVLAEIWAGAGSSGKVRKG
jgi:hypothetical protein